MSSPTVNSVHINTAAKPAPPVKRLNMAQLKAVLERLAAMMETDVPDETKVIKVYPHEHAARQLDPSGLKIIGSKELTAGIRAIFALVDGKSVIQSLRFDSAKYTPAEAKAWLKAHNYSTAQFEAAVAKAMQTCDECGAEAECTEVDGQILCADCAAEMADVTKAAFSDEPWESPESQLSTTDYAKVVLVNENTGASDTWVKSKMHLPVRKTPGGPINKAALRNASARLEQTQMSAASKATAKRKLARMMAQAGIKSELNKDDVDIEADILKADNEQRIAWGVAYPCQPLGWKDTQSDWADETQIAKMAWNFMRNSRRYDVQHQRAATPDEAVVVESYLAPVDFTLGEHTVTKGSWVVATHFPNEASWQLVKSGQVKAYSIRGKGKRKAIVPQS